MKESSIERAVVNYLTRLGWEVTNVHGNLYSSGLPDKYIVHLKHKQRWLELKRPDKYKFTNAQLRMFPIIHICRVGIWIMASTQDYQNLFGPPNWHKYLRKSEREKIRKIFEGDERLKQIEEEVLNKQ